MQGISFVSLTDLNEFFFFLMYFRYWDIVSHMCYKHRILPGCLVLLEHFSVLFFEDNLLNLLSSPSTVDTFENTMRLFN